MRIPSGNAAYASTNASVVRESGWLSWRSVRQPMRAHRILAPQTSPHSPPRSATQHQAPESWSINDDRFWPEAVIAKQLPLPCFDSVFRPRDVMRCAHKSNVAKQPARGGELDHREVTVRANETERGVRNSRN